MGIPLKLFYLIALVFTCQIFSSDQVDLLGYTETLSREFLDQTGHGKAQECLDNLRGKVAEIIHEDQNKGELHKMIRAQADMAMLKVARAFIKMRNIKSSGDLVRVEQRLLEKFNTLYGKSPSTN